MELLNGGGWLKPTLLSLFFWGIWGFLAKVGANKISWQTVMVLYGICILVFGIVAGPEKPKLDLYHLIALVAGITGALGFLYFFLALSKGPATVVIPLTSLYVAVSSILALLILSEPLTLKKGLGIISAVLAMILLTG